MLPTDPHEPHFHVSFESNSEAAVWWVCMVLILGMTVIVFKLIGHL